MGERAEAARIDLSCAEVALADARRSTGHDIGCECSVCWQINVALAATSVAVTESELLDDEDEEDQ